MNLLCVIHDLRDTSDHSRITRRSAENILSALHHPKTPQFTPTETYAEQTSVLAMKPYGIESGLEGSLLLESQNNRRQQPWFLV